PRTVPCGRMAPLLNRKPVVRRVARVRSRTDLRPRGHAGRKRVPGRHAPRGLTRAGVPWTTVAAVSTSAWIRAKTRGEGGAVMSLIKAIVLGGVLTWLVSLVLG